MRFGVPFSELDTVFFGASLERSRSSPGHQHPGGLPGLCQPVRLHQHSLPLTVGWSRDSRDSTLAPTSGRYQRVYGDWGVAGDIRYVRANYQSSSTSR
jgi:outer membrane protein insertion porin family